MIVQLINNISWASLLVSESKTWQRETSSVMKENSTAKNRSITEEIKTVGVRSNNV